MVGIPLQSKTIRGMSLLASPDEERANGAPPLPENPVSRVGDLWVRGKHRVLGGGATQSEDVARLLGERKPILMVTDPPYGIELDSEWRDRAGLNGHGPAEPSYMKRRTKGHTETTISGDCPASFIPAPTGRKPSSWSRACRSPTSGTPPSLRARSLTDCYIKPEACRYGWNRRHEWRSSLGTLDLDIGLT